jgi:3-methyladenine DNA glycosylase AlkD
VRSGAAGVRGGNLRAQALVAERLHEARGLGLALAELIDEPEAFVQALREGFERLADEAYTSEMARVAPTPDRVLPVRGPLQAAVATQLRRPLRASSSASALWLAQRLAVEPEREIRLFSQIALRRSLPDDPERSWQLMRRLARAAADWISVDSLAALYAQGILAEPYRWAELEQLVYSSDRWERRLVGATVATMPHELPRQRRRELASAPALMLIKSLLGDAEADVQKSLSWALRSWWEVDPAGTGDLLRAEATAARATNDGHRAWVLRDALTLPTLDPGLAGEIRSRLEGIRRSPGAAPSSIAADVVGRFGRLDELTESAINQQGQRMDRSGLRGNL